MEMSEPHAVVALSPEERFTGTHSIGGWVCPRAAIDAMEKRNLVLPGTEPMLSSPSLYRLLLWYGKEKLSLCL
jgi:hypothetical protein